MRREMRNAEGNTCRHFYHDNTTGNDYYRADDGSVWELRYGMLLLCDLLTEDSIKGIVRAALTTGE